MRRKMVLFFMLLPLLVIAHAGEPLDRVVAVVNDNVIAASELQEQVDVLRQQILSKKMQLPTEDVLRKQVLQHLIDLELQLQLAKNNKINIDDAELDSTVATIAKNNHLDLNQLREALKNQGLDWKAYRENLRKEMLIRRVQQNAVGQGITISAQQVDDYLKTAMTNQKQQQSYHLQNIVIPLPEAPTTAQLKKAQQKARFLLRKIKQGEDFSGLAIAESSGEYALEGGDLGLRHLAELPDVFSREVVNMEVGQVKGPLRTGNGYQLIKLTAIEGNEAPHKVTKTHVRHILLKQDANMTAIDAEKQINNIYQQLKSGKDFALMAKQYSLDATSAVNGGDLGWVSGEELVPQFAESMNKLAPHKVSKPVKSPFGWHLIEVLERKTVDDTIAFQRQQVRQFLHQRKFSDSVQNWLQHIRTDAYVNIVEKSLA